MYICDVKNLFIKTPYNHLVVRSGADSDHNKKRVGNYNYNNLKLPGLYYNLKYIKYILTLVNVRLKLKPRFMILFFISDQGEGVASL